MREYEAVVILNDTKFEGGTEPFIDELERYISELGGTVREKESWGRKRFVHPIKQQQGGTYWDLKLELPAEKVETLKQAFRLDERVLRLVVYLDEKKEKTEKKEVLPEV